MIHKFPNNSEKPIGGVSRTLNDAEKNYSVTNKEGLAIVFGIKKFFHYLYGNQFTIRTDHKPLLGLFGPEKGIPEISSARVQRWVIFMSAFTYNMEHISGKNNQLAESFSRLPSSCTEVTEEEYFEINFGELKKFVDYDVVLKETLNDMVLNKVKNCIKSNCWSNIVYRNQI